MPSPNILWIVTTQWRAQACGFAGDPNARTPHLDALAAQGVNYAQAVTPHPFGPFARAALLTGVPSPENGIVDYFDPLPAGAKTVAHALRERGYAAAFFGKWHLGRRDPAAPLVGEEHARTIVPPDARGGFETWEGFESGFQLNDPWLHGRGSERPRRHPGYQSDVVCARAVDFLQTKAPPAAGANAQPPPWFVVVSLEPPHPPYDAPAAGVAARDPREIILPANVPRGGDGETKARRELAGYYAHIEATDRAIGQLLLPAAGGNTIVVFTSVHGDLHGAHGQFRKGWPHEESIRVPLVVRAPRAYDGFGFGVLSSELVSLLDLPRWAIDWAKMAEPKNQNPKLKTQNRPGPAARQIISMPSVVALPHQCDRRWRGIRTASRKLVLNDDGSPWLFFDLAADPLEMKNLVGEPAFASELAALRTEVLSP